MDDRIRAALASDGVVDVTTVGARSGESRRTEIWFLHLEGRTFVTGTPGRRNWYANLLAHDRLTLHLEESLVADLPARAVPVRDEATRRWVFTRPHRWNDWYLGQAGLEDLVARSPMVELFFDEVPP